MTRILLTRHGHVEGIHPPRFRGRFDMPLSEAGREQARAVAARIAAHWKVAAIYTSPLRRCVETGQAIAAASGAAAAVLDALADLDYGAWEWKTHAEMREAFPQAFADWFAHPERGRFPEGESLQDLVARTADAVRLVHRTHPAETVVMVGHDSVNRAILMQMLDQPLSAYWRLYLHPCGLSEIDYGEHHIRVERVNDTSHLTF